MVPRPIASVLASFVLAALAAACGGEGSAELPPVTPASTSTTSAPRADVTTAPKPAERITKLTRAQVLAYVKGGVGRFLHDGRIEFDDAPVMRAGKFHGRKIVAFRPDWDIGVQPGDILLEVNGNKLAFEDDAFAALQAAAKAPSLRIGIERAGAVQTIDLPIVD